ncbi:MAG: ribbon-helix-helix protein, CopG family [Actinomycetota bacterium]|nr:ribbon-helix-helix protein, CopG family [Actinomycetota bacterium]
MSKVMVSLPEDLLAAVDREAKRRATTRSALLALAVRRELSRRDPDEVAAAVARSEQRFEQAGVFESTDIIRRARDSGR